jgi:Phospholipase_D-nuclease N-terminal
MSVGDEADLDREVLSTRAGNASGLHNLLPRPKRTMNMILATGYPFLEILWTMLILFALVAWFYLVFIVFADIFRRHDESGWTKVLWIIFVILLPYFGVFIYLIVENGRMGQRGSEPRRHRHR